MSSNIVLLFCALSATLQVLNACNANLPTVMKTVQNLQAANPQKCMQCPILQYDCKKEFLMQDASCGRPELFYKLAWRQQTCGRAEFYCYANPGESVAIGVQVALARFIRTLAPTPTTTQAPYKYKVFTPAGDEPASKEYIYVDGSAECPEGWEDAPIDCVYENETNTIPQSATEAPIDCYDDDNDTTTAVAPAKNPVFVAEPLIFVNKKNGKPSAEVVLDCNDNGYWEVVDGSGNVISGVDSVFCLSAKDF